MCICINCHWVDRCKAYHAVERQHGAKHLTEDPDWEPQDPRIHISLISLPGGDSGVEWDVRDCDSFLEDNGRWIRLCPNQELPR